MDEAFASIEQLERGPLVIDLKQNYAKQHARGCPFEDSVDCTCRARLFATGGLLKCNIRCPLRNGPVVVRFEEATEA